MNSFYTIIYNLYLYKKGSDDSKILGKGIINILRRLDNVASIRCVAQEMNLSYSKAVMIINRAENELQLKLVNRNRGGNERRGSTLTDEGKKIIELWDKLNTDVGEYINSRAVSFLKELSDIQQSKK